MTITITRRKTEPHPCNFPSDMPELLQRIYKARGIFDTNLLDKDLTKLLSFDKIKGIDEACAILVRSITNDEKILIVGDFDCDGATSSAVAIKSLKAMGAKQVDYLVPNRFEYGYGLTPEIVNLASKKKPDIIITVDNGISSIQGVNRAHELDIKVIITDHHLPGEELPMADAIVNPNQLGCLFAGKNTAGVGVIFYLLCALRAKLSQEGWFSDKNKKRPNMASVLDLVALGTVADVVPLDSNNRILIDQGIKRIRSGNACLGIMALIDISGCNCQKLSSSDLGFSLGPRLNAAGRLDDMSIGIELLLTDDKTKAKKLAIELDELNKERKSIEASMEIEAMKELNLLDFSGLETQSYSVCLFGEQWHQGVIGILASRVKEKLNRPVVIFAKDNNDKIKGSCRSIPGIHIRDILESISKHHPELLISFGGHAMAAGLTIFQNKYTVFTKAFENAIKKNASPELFINSIITDGELEKVDFSIKTANAINDAGPWGQGFPEPIFDGYFNVIEQKLVAKKHLKMILAPNDSNIPINAIWFNVNCDVWPNLSIKRARFVYQLSVNEFRGKTTLQLIVRNAVDCSIQ